MPEPLAEQILRHIPDTADLYYRVLLVVGAAGSGKTAALQSLATRPGYAYINVNLELSRRLLELSESQRPMAVPRLLRDVVEAGEPTVALLDNIEILFDTSLKLHPLQVLQRLARNRTVVAAWNGAVTGGYLTYASPEHPEYRRYAVRELLVVTPEAADAASSEES